MHVSGDVTVAPNAFVPIVSYVAPSFGTIECVGAVLWGETFAEFSIYKNGAYIGGGRTSAASPTLQLDYYSCPVGLSSNDVLLVMAEHGSSQQHEIKATLLVNQL